MTDVISCPVLQFPAAVIKTSLSTVTLQALTVSLRVVTRESSSGGTAHGNLSYNAAVPFFDHSALEQTLVTSLYLRLPQRPSDSLPHVKMRQQKTKKTWSCKDTVGWRGWQ